MKEFYKIYVYEDNAGGLHLVLLDEDANFVYYYTGYEGMPGSLSQDLDALMHGDDPRMWESNCKDKLDMMYLEWETNLIADGDTICGIMYDYDNMGNAGRKEFA